MRFKNLIPLLLTITLLFPGLAFANPAGEQLILREINIGSFEVWKHSDGRWQDTDYDGTPDIPGQANKSTKPLTYSMPKSNYTSEFEFTRAVVKATVTQQDYNDSKTMQRPNESWNSLGENYLQYLPNSYSINYSSSPAGSGQPTVSVTRVLTLSPELLDLKDPAVRQALGRDERYFLDMTEGWMWYTPIIIEWYGVPKEKPFNLVASSITSGAPGKAIPGQRYSGTVTFKYFGADPAPNAPIGVFNGDWPAILKDPSGNVVTTASFQPNDIKTFTFDWTAPTPKKDGDKATLTGAISITPPLNSDPYPKEPNKDDNIITLDQEITGYDIEVSVYPLDDIFYIYPKDEGKAETLTTVFVVRKDNLRERIPVKLTVTANGGKPYTETFTMSSGVGAQQKFSYKPRLPEGSYTIKAEAWPSDSSWTDINPANNVDTARFKVEVIDIAIPDPANKKIRVGL